MRKILEMLLVLPLVVLLLLAVAGALVALVGGLAGLENARIVGGTVSGIGAIGFFALLLSPLGQIITALLGMMPGGTVQSNVSAAAPSTGGPRNKENVK